MDADRRAERVAAEFADYMTRIDQILLDHSHRAGRVVRGQGHTPATSPTFRSSQPQAGLPAPFGAPSPAGAAPHSGAPAGPTL